MRFSRAGGDLKIDTSPEVLGQAVGGYSQNHYPFALCRALGPSLTANMQGAKRPLGASTKGNQQVMMPQHNAFDGYKVSGTLVSPRNTRYALVCIHVCNGPADRLRSPSWNLVTNRLSWTRYCSVSTVALHRPINTIPPPALCPSRRLPMSSRPRHPRPWTTRCSLSTPSSYKS
jgi:hypothetical protein